MTQKIPKRYCEQCKKHNPKYGCTLRDLEPCIYAEEVVNERAKDRFLAVVTIFAGIVIAAIILLSCMEKKEEESTPEEPVSAVALLRELHKGELSQWDKLIMAIAFTESRFNENAVGSSNDFGILQITPIYVKEVNRVNGTDYAHEDAFEPALSVEMFEAMQSVKNPSHGIEEAIRLHNKSPEYRKKVLQNLEFIERYESFRNVLTK